MADPSDLECVLDERHKAAREAYSHKAPDRYQEIFHPDLEYRQLDGRTIDRARLVRDVKVQFARLSKADSSFAREEISIDGDQVIEVLSQIARAEATAFGFVRRSWRVLRRGRYTWKISDGLWRIARVQILSEAVRSDGWRFGI